MLEETRWVEAEWPSGEAKTFRVGEDDIERIPLSMVARPSLSTKRWTNGRRWSKAHNGPFLTVGWKPAGSA